MTAPTWQQIKDAAMTQILAIAETGQTVTADGRTLTYADIEGLERLIQRADSHIAKAARGGIARMVGVVPRT